jgi:hypothetical protein
MKYRRLRIFISALFGVLTLLLCVLWVRSYWRSDTIYTESRTYKSVNGEFAVEPVRISGFRWSIDRNPVTSELPPSSFGFRYATARGVRWPVFQYWSPAIFCASLSVLPWVDRIPYRFSLRTLLIATTIIAALLGLGVWAVR